MKINAGAEAQSTWRRIVGTRPFQIAAFVLVLVLSLVGVFFFRSYLEPQAILTYGYAGVFFVNLINASTILLPLPGEAVNVAAGVTLNPLWLGAIGGLGAASGELTGYFAGRLGWKVIIGDKYQEKYEKAKTWLDSHGFLTVFVFALVPVFFMDLIGLVAGSVRFPLWKFFLACWAGKLLRCFLASQLGWGVFGSLF